MADIVRVVGAFLIVGIGAGIVTTVVMNRSEEVGGYSPPAPSPPPPPPPKEPARRDLDSIFAEVATSRGLDMRAPADSEDGRSVMAESLTQFALDDVAVLFRAEGRVLVVSAYGASVCSAEAIADVEAMSRPFLAAVGFKKIKCDREGHTVNVR